MDFYHDYLEHRSQRLQQGLPPLPLNQVQTGDILARLKCGDSTKRSKEYLSLLLSRVRPGVDPAAEFKARYLYEVAIGATAAELLTPSEAVKALGQMKSGFGVRCLIDLLSHPIQGSNATRALSKLVHIYDDFDRICALANEGVLAAMELLEDWATESWFRSSPEVQEVTQAIAFYAEGVTTTDDLSPAGDVITRADIPLHALAMLKWGRGAIKPDVRGERGPISLIERLKKEHSEIVFCGDIVGIGSSRASATNSLMWHFGMDIEGQPNKRRGGITIAGQFAPIFLNTQRDYGVLPLTAEIGGMSLGDELTIDLREATLTIAGKGTRSIQFCAPETLDEVRVGGRLNYRLGKRLTARARTYLEPASKGIAEPVARRQLS